MHYPSSAHFIDQTRTRSKSSDDVPSAEGQEAERAPSPPPTLPLSREQTMSAEEFYAALAGENIDLDLDMDMDMDLVIEFVPIYHLDLSQLNSLDLLRLVIVPQYRELGPLVRSSAHCGLRVAHSMMDRFLRSRSVVRLSE